MKKRITLILCLLILSCANTDREVYNIEATLLNGAIDTFDVEIAYNKDLRNIEASFVKSDMFNEAGIETAYSLAGQHPLGVFYKDTLDKIKPSLIQFSKIAKDYDNPLGEKLINNSIVFNRSLLVQRNIGEIQSFRVLSKKAVILKTDTGGLDQKLLAFINDPNVIAQDLDKIPYVTTKASVNIVNARPIKSAYELNKIPYVSDETVKRLRQYAETYKQ
jgi:DNA uptake protein ComE-like DNA-binding protein